MPNAKIMFEDLSYSTIAQSQVNGCAVNNPTVVGGTADSLALGQSAVAPANVADPGATSDSSSKAATTNWVQRLLGFSLSLGSSLSFGTATQGYIKFFGIILQWGNVLMPGSGSSDNPTNFNFAIAFPNACLVCVPGTFSPTADRITFLKSVTASGGVMSNNGSAANAVYIAIGY